MRTHIVRALSASLFLFAPVAIAADVVGTGRIVWLENGWAGEGLALHLDNSGATGCPSPSTEFAVNKNHPAFRELTAIALTAYTSGANVELVGDRGVCHMGRTSLISIRLRS